MCSNCFLVLAPRRLLHVFIDCCDESLQGGVISCEERRNGLSTAPRREVEKRFERFLQEALGLPAIPLVQESKQCWKAVVALLPESFGIKVATGFISLAPKSAKHSGNSKLTAVIRD